MLKKVQHRYTDLSVPHTVYEVPFSAVRVPLVEGGSVASWRFVCHLLKLLAVTVLLLGS